ncbi:VanZ family protein [Streptomyces sp. KR80]|uniref:VanZ family protein n=1 Tax=Streptomyces sp. KR80 TaxID=3457426 RepID=UPI003FD498D7
MQRHGPGGIPIYLRVTGLVLLVAHLLLVAWVALRPLSVPWVAPENLRPLATIRTELAQGLWEAAHSLAPQLLLLAPLGVLLPVVTGRVAGSLLGSLAHTAFTGAMVSLAIELMQTDVPGRTLDVDAVLLNTAGVGVTHLSLVPPLRAWLRRNAPQGHGGRIVPLPREEGSQGPTPTIPRVGIAPQSDALPVSRT